MKLKSNPEDFIVEELTDFFLDGGPYAFYRLEKRSLGTRRLLKPSPVHGGCLGMR